MPTWRPAPQPVLDEVLNRVWSDIDMSQTLDASFEEVTGMSIDQLSEHAAKMVAMLVKDFGADLGQPTTLLQIYCLGFVVGTKNGEYRSPGHSSHER
jgi:hypothetical protein